jgi:transcriptional regulator with XRE-family HTH domain
MSQLSDRLKSRRTELGLSVSETARRAGVNRTYLQRLEKGDAPVRVSAQVAFGLADTLSISAYELLPEVLSSRARSTSRLVAAISDYLAVDKPDPRLVASLAALEFENADLSPEEREITSAAMDLLMAARPGSNEIVDELAELIDRIPPDHFTKILERRLAADGPPESRASLLSLLAFLARQRAK